MRLALPNHRSVFAFHRRSDLPDVAEGVRDLAGAHAVELILGRADFFGTGCDGACCNGVNVIHYDIHFYRRAAWSLWRDRSKIRELIGKIDLGIANANFGVADLGSGSD